MKNFCLIKKEKKDIMKSCITDKEKNKVQAQVHYKI